MSNEKTDHLKLNKWNPDDYVQVEEFNENFQKIDDDSNKVSTQLADTANEIEVLETSKMSKDTNDISVFQINKNKGKIDQIFMTDEFIRQFVENTQPVNSTPAGLSLTTQKYSDKSVTGSKTDFISMSKNLYNRYDITDKKSISGTTGELVDNVNNATSGFIPVTPSTAYKSFNVARRGYYTSDFSFVSSDTTPSGEGTFTTPPNVYYMRAVVGNQEGLLSVARINIGNTLLPFEKYQSELKNVYVDGKLIKDQSLPVSVFPDKSITMGKLDFIKLSTNIFNKKDSERGVNIDSSTGEETPSLHETTGFIEVNSNSEYITNFGLRIANYNKEKGFLGNSSKGVDGVFTTKENAYYIRIVDNPSNNIKKQVNKGSILLPYEEYSLFLDGVSIDNKTTYSELVNLDKIIVEGKTDGTYSSIEIPAYPQLANDKTVDIIAMYDLLVSKFPDYVSKKILGKDDFANDIIRYDFKFEDVPTTVEERKTPKMILVSGMHNERAGVYNLYQAMKQICESWETDELLETLRRNVHFIVVPVVNVYGYDNDTRKNGKGVDLSRNFSADWVLEKDPESSVYGGAFPLSEPETRYIDEIMRENSDAILFASCHNFWSSAGKTDFIWHAAATLMQVNVAKSLISKMSRKWKKEQTFLLQNNTFYVGRSNLTAPEGSEGRQAAVYGIQGGTFEVSQNIRDATDSSNFSTLSNTWGAEALINFLLLNLKHNVDYYNYH